MAQIKITITIEATLMRDAHEAVDAMDAALRKRDGRVVKARLTQEPKGRIAAKYDWTASEPAPLTKWVVLYTRIPTNYNPQQKLVVEAATEADAREIVREHIGDRGKQLSTYAIEDTKPYEPLAVAGRVVGGAL
jgi:hypothetical protein